MKSEKHILWIIWSACYRPNTFSPSHLRREARNNNIPGTGFPAFEFVREEKALILSDLSFEFPFRMRCSQFITINLTSLKFLFYAALVIFRYPITIQSGVMFLRVFAPKIGSAHGVWRSTIPKKPQISTSQNAVPFCCAIDVRRRRMARPSRAIAG